MIYTLTKRFLIINFGANHPIIHRLARIKSRFTHNKTTPDEPKRARLQKSPSVLKNLESKNKEQLLSLIDQPISEKSKLDLFRHLFRLKNFTSASIVAKTIEHQNLAPLDLFQIIKCLLSSTDGTYADLMLDKYIQHSDISALSESDQKAIIDLIFFSGSKAEVKFARLNKVICSSTSETVRKHARFQEFRIRLNVDSNIDILEYAEIDTLELANPGIHLRYISHLKAMGYPNEARSILERLYRYHGLQNPTVLVALLNFDPEWPGVNLSDLPERFLDRLDILQLAHDQKEINQHFQILYENSLNKIRELYHDANIYKKDQILTRLLRLDLLDEIQGLISSHLQLPNTVLSQFSAEGLNCFVANNFLSARDHFKRVIEEDPSDSIAAQGLRLTLPRAGGKMDSILEVRNKHGYGITGAGRTGVNASIGSDKTISLLMSGQYKSGLYSKRHAAHWQLLKRIYGDRFYNYEQIPTDGSIKNLFIIGDEGVGDEVRTAQFYSYLSKTFERITISCDPRLTNIFQYSFPNITFIPVERYRKGLTKNSSSSDPRISGLNQKLSQILTNECKDLMDQADGITFGQNLFFNRFIGNIPFNKQGGYLSQNIKRQSTAKLKIGILWRSHFVTMWRKFMYLKVEDFLPITKLENIEIWSMQHCIEEDELEFCHKNNIKIVEGIDFFNDFDGMSPILEGLDLMIGISSLPMELAAAAGTPVWMLGFSPENYFLRTAGGNKEADQLSTNSTIIAPQWIDFSAPTTDCISLVMQEACKKLSKLQTSSSQHLQKTAPIALQC